MKRSEFLTLLAAIPCVPMIASRAKAAESVWTYKAEFLRQLVAGATTLLDSQDKTSGRFGTGIWIVTDQNVIYPLAAAWAIRDETNPHYHSPQVLEAVMKGGDALIDAQNARGKWVFRKKDNSTWGDIYMPWTYSRWIRAFGLIRDAIPPERRARWEKALTLGFEGIAANELKTVHNIPAHHAMGLYRAGEVLQRPEWKAQAEAFLRRVAAEQDEGGFWSENHGPVVGYNFVYVDALGTYYAQSRDAKVLSALERAARFHANFTYPNGSAVETVDERQFYHSNILMPGVGFSFSPEGRGYIRRQWQLISDKAAEAEKQPVLSADAAASFVLYGEEGAATSVPGERERHHFVLGKQAASIARQKPWFVAFSAYHTPVPQSRWIQDRQNLFSLFHDKVGLIVGGGNTKLQPLWSSFVVGDITLLCHTAGNEKPNFAPPKGVFHVPKATTLEADKLALSLVYGDTSEVSCRVEAKLDNNSTTRLIYSVITAPFPQVPVTAHVPLLPRLNGAWQTASAKSGTLDATHLKLTAGETGSWFEHNGWRITLPAGASLTWPALPHDPYKKDGRAALKDGRLVIALPFTSDRTQQEVTIQIVN